jgi:TolB-like protein/DNA-binding winged helix-turn-helix (wHTH) protein/Tfp pilus assembly protein PilF
MPQPLRFGQFELDRQNFELRRDGKPVKLDRTALELLLFLVERAGALVTREEAVEQVWGKGVFIEAESSLYTAIRKVRRALGDDTAEPQFIQTVSRKGYRFIGKVEGSQALSAHPSPATVAANPRRHFWMLGVALACVVTVGALVVRWRIAGRPAGPRRLMLVVLPLENLSGDPQQEYLVDGITEEIIARVGNLDPKDLGVIARTSAMQYKHTQKDATQIAHELGVTYLLEGSVQRSGESIRVTEQLIQSSDQTHLWAESYDRDLGDVFKVESDIAGAVASEIRLTLSEHANLRLAAATRVDPEAHDAYLRGLAGWNQRSRDGFLQAIANFERATQLDPNYASAFAGLARVYSLAPIFAGMPVNEAAPKALEAADRALKLDETLADAHSSVGFVKAHYQYDWLAAERELRRAVELEPNNPYAHFFYSNSYLSPFGRHEEAIAEMRKALELDPLSTRIRSFAGVTFTWARRYDEALAQYQEVDRLDPNFALNHERMAGLYATLAKYEEAAAEETKARLLSGEKREDVVAKMKKLRGAAAAKGGRGYWEIELEFAQGRQNPPEANGDFYGLAHIYSMLGDKDQALANLEKAYSERDEQMTNLAVDPDFNSLRSDPRFRDMEHRIGILSQ